MLKNRETYEIITPEDIGLDINDTLVLGKHSGRAAFRAKLEKLGFKLDDDALNSSFEKFKILADKKKHIYDDDLRAIVTNEMTKSIQVYELISLQIMNCSNGIASSTISIKKDENEIIDASIGEGTIDAIFKTIDRVSGFNGRLMDYRVTSVSQGKDALANVTVKVVFNDNEPAIIGHGLNIDTVLASAKAYISALNSYLSMQGMLRKSGSSIETV
jgi:2-isopropylmalate synthase